MIHAEVVFGFYCAFTTTSAIAFSIVFDSSESHNCEFSESVRDVCVGIYSFRGACELLYGCCYDETTTECFYHPPSDPIVLSRSAVVISDSNLSFCDVPNAERTECLSPSDWHPSARYQCEIDGCCYDEANGCFLPLTTESEPTQLTSLPTDDMTTDLTSTTGSTQATTAEDATTPIEETTIASDDITQFTSLDPGISTSLNPTTEDATNSVDETPTDPTVKYSITFAEETTQISRDLAQSTSSAEGSTFTDKTTEPSPSLNPTTENSEIYETSHLDETTHWAMFSDSTMQTTFAADSTTQFTSLNPTTSEMIFASEISQPTFQDPTTKLKTNIINEATQSETSAKVTTSQPSASLNPTTEDSETDETFQLDETTIWALFSGSTAKTTIAPDGTTQFTSLDPSISTSFNPTTEDATNSVDETPSDPTVKFSIAFAEETTQISTDSAQSTSSPEGSAFTDKATELSPSLNPTTEDAEIHETSHLDETTQWAMFSDSTMQTTFALNGTTQFISLNPKTREMTFAGEINQPTSQNPTTELKTNIINEATQSETSAKVTTSQPSTSLNPTTQDPETDETSQLDETTHWAMFSGSTAETTIDGTTQFTSLDPSISTSLTEVATKSVDETPSDPTVIYSITFTEETTQITTDSAQSTSSLEGPTFTDKTTEPSSSSNPTTEDAEIHETSHLDETTYWAMFSDSTMQTTIASDSTTQFTSVNPTTSEMIFAGEISQPTSQDPTTEKTAIIINEIAQSKTSPESTTSQPSTLLNPTTQDAETSETSQLDETTYWTMFSGSTVVTTIASDGITQFSSLDPTTSTTFVDETEVNLYAFTYDSNSCSDDSDCAQDAVEVFKKYCDSVDDKLCNNYRIRDFDECQYANGETEHNNCSVNARCINTYGSYTCECNSAYVDLDPVIPGRNCSHLEN